MQLEAHVFTTRGQCEREVLGRFGAEFQVPAVKLDDPRPLALVTYGWLIVAEPLSNLNL